MTTTDQNNDRGNDPGDELTDSGDTRLLIRRYGGAPFAIRGFVDGREVSAETVDAAIVVDEVLYRRACRLAERGERFDLPDYGMSFDAEVEGDGMAVALTFLRSFDRILSMRMSLGAN